MGGVGCLCTEVHSLDEPQAKLNFSVDTTTDDHYLQLFEGLFPSRLLTTIIEKVKEKISGDLVSKGEFLQWISMWVLMSTVDGSDQ